MMMTTRRLISQTSATRYVAPFTGAGIPQPPKVRRLVRRLSKQILALMPRYTFIHFIVSLSQYIHHLPRKVSLSSETSASETPKTLGLSFEVAGTPQAPHIHFCESERPKSVQTRPPRGPGAPETLQDPLEPLPRPSQDLPGSPVDASVGE